MDFEISAVSQELKAQLQAKIDNKTKPLGSLGVLEKIALHAGLIQNTIKPVISKPSLTIFAADHGLAKEGVSAYPQEVTYQMVKNFMHGGAAANCFSEQHNIKMTIVDVGVNADFETTLDVESFKVSYGTNNILEDKAMSEEDCLKAMNVGAQIIQKQFDKGTNTAIFGEMGIGNTSSAALLMNQICGIELSQCVGSGTGLDQDGVQRKLATLKKCVEKHGDLKAPLDILSTYGGFESAALVGAMLKAAELRMMILIDGFIVTSALLVAQKMNKNVLDYCIFCHTSQESGHAGMLEFLGKEALINLGLRLGEGSGALVAFPIIQSSVQFLSNMASFEEASVSGKEG